MTKKELLEKLGWKRMDKYFFKSGKDLVLNTQELNDDLEEMVLFHIRQNGFLCVPYTIPTNGYFRIERTDKK